MFFEACVSSRSGRTSRESCVAVGVRGGEQSVDVWAPEAPGMSPSVRRLCSFLEGPGNLTAPLGNTEHKGIRVTSAMKQEEPLYYP